MGRAISAGRICEVLVQILPLVDALTYGLFLQDGNGFVRVIHLVNCPCCLTDI
jgi:hypothetical protein